MVNFFSLKIKKSKVIPTINNAGLLSILLAVYSMLVYFFVLAIGQSMPFEMDLNSMMISAGLFLILGLGVYFRNRFFAIVLVIVYILDRISSLVLFSLNGNIISSVISFFIGIVFTMYFIRGAKAVFVYHKHLKK